MILNLSIGEEVDRDPRVAIGVPTKREDGVAPSEDGIETLPVSTSAGDDVEKGKEYVNVESVGVGRSV